MPMKSKDKSTPAEPSVTRRRSARLAELDKDKPKETPKVAKKASTKKSPKAAKTPKGDNEVEAVVENNHVEEVKNDSTDSIEASKEEPEKTQEKKEEDKMETDIPAEKEEVVHKDDVPPADSAEVKQAEPAVVETKPTEPEPEREAVNGESETKVVEVTAKETEKKIENPPEVNEEKAAAPVEATTA